MLLFLHWPLTKNFQQHWQAVSRPWAVWATVQSIFLRCLWHGHSQNVLRLTYDDKIKINLGHGRKFGYGR
jgi:hypothetical protein